MTSRRRRSKERSNNRRKGRLAIQLGIGTENVKDGYNTDSLNSHDSLESLNSLRTPSHSILQPHHLVETPPGEARPGRKRAPTPEELRRRLQLIPENTTVHPRATFGPTEPREDKPSPNEE
ncbi:hypothetical protein GEV33_001560 [Tenebrio molitor]|uniref:Uncharacterized protein n=1 Tax=Tenebrio molitor TaxID=7067 RepID=A0A8J6HWS8_TENMO|nr:hypothetical protein GEV33_001560 [Tenebrio molitor]